MSLLGVIWERERVCLYRWTSRTAEFGMGSGEGGEGGVGVEVVVIRRLNRNPWPGRSGRRLHLATSRHQSADGDKLAETKPFKSNQCLNVQSRTAVCCGATSTSSQQTDDLNTSGGI